MNTFHEPLTTPVPQLSLVI